jgi:predicted nuclease with TOPRIM domain
LTELVEVSDGSLVKHKNQAQKRLKALRAEQSKLDVLMKRSSENSKYAARIQNLAAEFAAQNELVEQFQALH